MPLSRAFSSAWNKCDEISEIRRGSSSPSGTEDTFVSKKRERKKKKCDSLGHTFDSTTYEQSLNRSYRRFSLSISTVSGVTPIRHLNYKSNYRAVLAPDATVFDNI